MMSNFKLTLFLTTICITCCYVNEGQSQSASILDRDFTLKALVDCYDGSGKSLVGETSVTELYSKQDRRGLVRLKVTNGANRIGYHYDGNHNVWIQVIPRENLCISSSQYDLDLRLYESPVFSKMDEIYKAICPDCSNDASQRHLIGTAKLLASVQRLRPKFGRPIEISSRAGDHLTVYNLANLKVDDSASVDLFVHYSKILDVTFRPSNFVQPQLVRLHYRNTKENVTHVIAVTFYHFELLSDMTSGQDEAEKVQHPLSLPTGMFCSKALRSALGERKQAELEMIQVEYNHLNRFSFSAKDLDSQSSLELTYFALDLKAKLIRKDLLVSDLQSTTIYNLKDRIRYNMVTSRDSKNAEECVTNKIDDSIVDSNVKFIDFDRLVYMGKARINSVDTLIYEEFSSKYSSSSLQFWLHAPVWATPKNEKDPRFRVDELQGEHIYVTYYFALGLGGQQSISDGDGIGSLLQVDITVRDSVSRVIWFRRMAISGFVAGRAEPTYSGMQMFSFANICRLDTKSGQVTALLESSHCTNVSLHEIHPSLLERDERNEIFVEALDREYAIQRSQIDHLSAQILTRDASEKVTFEIDMTISENLDQTLSPIECVYLGRGQLLGYDSPGAKNYTGITTFEDCMWLAHRHLIDLNGEEVMFTYTDRIECFVDRLFRYRSLQGHEAIIAGSSSSVSLNYYPYEFGTKKIYTIDKKRGETDATHISDKGMHFFRVGSFKMIGNNLELRLPSRDKLNLIFRRMNLSGYLAKIHGEKLNSGRISGLSWSLDDAKNESNKLVALSESADGEMTEVECQTHCMFDLSCNSYSFCSRRLGIRESQCLISLIDASKPLVMKQLEAIKDNLTRARTDSKKTIKRSATIMFDEGSLQQPEIKVILDKSCSISAKSHADLFRRMYPVTVATSAMINSIDKTIRDMDECAKRCFAKNIGYLKRLAHHKIANPESIYISDDLSKPESISDLVQEGLRDMCTSFLYADDMPRTNTDNQTVRGCLLVTPTSPEPTHQMPKIEENVEHVKMEAIPMLQYKLVFSHLFKRIAGIRMLSVSEVNDLDDSEFIRRNGFMNNQIKLSIDDAEFCARACMRQTHGPKPMCSSFDFVHEHVVGRSIKYCLLNSLSLHDLKSAGESDFLHETHEGVSFWHFEPRDAALQIATPQAKPHKSVEADTCVPTSSSGAFMGIWLVLSLIVGLLIGLKMTSYMIEISNIETSGQTGRTSRLIHRLSGVSLRSNLREVEVQMS